MAYKITLFLIGIIVVSLLVIGFSNFIAETSLDYNRSYSNDTLRSLDKMRDIHNISEQIESRHAEDKTDPTLYDIIGNLVADTVDSVKLTFSGYNAVLEMGNEAQERLGLDVSYKYALYSIIIIVVIIGIFLAIKVGRDL